MDIARAREIIESPDIIPVVYQGKPVHLDEVYESTGYVRAHYEDGTVVNAPAAELQEEKPS
jgi:H-type small acid-soluble spore protein